MKTPDKIKRGLIHCEREECEGCPYYQECMLEDAHIVLHADILEYINELEAKVVEINGETSDGYHTFNELYHHRAVLFSVIVKAFPDKAWKSKQHNDGTMYDGMFIVGIDTPEGQATYHYDIDPYWDMFECQELERAPEWDGHTPAQAIERIEKLEPIRHGQWVYTTKEDSDWGGFFYTYTCSVCNWSMGDNPTGWGLFCPHCGAKMSLKER